MSALAHDLLSAMLNTPGGDGMSSMASAVEATKALEAGTATVTDPHTVLAHAARGNVEAMRHLADEALRTVMAGVDDTPLLTLHEGAIFARMAASATDDGEDHMQVVFLLAGCIDQSPDQATCQAYAGEIIARLEITADGSGDIAEQAARILANQLGKETPETMALAKEYRRRILAAKDLD